MSSKGRTQTTQDTNPQATNQQTEIRESSDNFSATKGMDEFFGDAQDSTDSGSSQGSSSADTSNQDTSNQSGKDQQ